MKKKLENYRSQIDRIDKDLIKLLAKRYQIVKKIGQLKKRLSLPPLDKKRWQEVLLSRISWGRKLGLSETLIKKIYQLIHHYALIIEKK